MNKIVTGVLFGAMAGIIDIIPMIFQNLTWDANFSAFFLWVVSGFLIATSNINTHPAIKGILISFLVLLPCSFIIGWHNPISLIPIGIMTLILGSLLGYFINKFGN